MTASWQWHSFHSVPLGCKPPAFPICSSNHSSCGWSSEYVKNNWNQENKKEARDLMLGLIPIPTVSFAGVWSAEFDILYTFETE